MILDALKGKGVATVSDHIMKTTEDEIRIEGKKERHAFLTQLHGWIQAADCVIVEATFPSISVGYEISLALHYKKPILLLYTQDAPSLFHEQFEDKVVCEKYTKDTLSSIIDAFISYIDDHTDARFTFFIPPHLAKHLDTMADKHRMPKSVYLRHLIEEDMAHHSLR